MAWILAAELPKVPLADALSLLLLALDEQPSRFETAAPRWHARLCDEARPTLAESQLAVAALDALAGHGAVAGGQALVARCEAHGLDDAVGVLDAWRAPGTERHHAHCSCQAKAEAAERSGSAAGACSPRPARPTCLAPERPR
jgi:hypothetical protein